MKFFNHPDSICRHLDEREPKPERVQTVASIYYESDKEEVHISRGRLFENEYQTSNFTSIYGLGYVDPDSFNFSDHFILLEDSQSFPDKDSNDSNRRGEVDKIHPFIDIFGL